MAFDPKSQVLPDSPIETPHPRRAGVLQVEGVGLRYEGASEHTLRDFNLEVRAGEIVSILGASGEGKTTALRVIAGFERVQEGYVRIGGRLVASSFTHVPADKRRVGLVFQDYALFPHLTVYENVAFGLRDAPRDARHERVDAMMSLTSLSGLEHRYAHELSGGQQQRVALARALAPAPVALLLDEPFSNLDRGLRSGIRREVRRIVKEAGATAILVTHDREEALALADRIAVMDGGRVEQIGEPSEVYARPATPNVARLVGACQILPGTIRGDVVETEAGSFPFEASGLMLDRGAKPESGTSVRALLRASELELTEWREGPEARVAYREFRGEFTEYGIGLPSGAVVRVRRRSEDEVSEGELVALCGRPGSRVMVYPA